MVKPGDKLEAFRNCPLVGESGMQCKLFGGDILPFLFHDSANIAFYMTVDALKAMQYSPAIGPTQYGIPAVNMWFLAVESLISMLYKVVFEDSKSKTPLNPTQRILDKASAIDSYISGGNVGTPRVRKQLAEFTTFRNMLFHDLTYVKRPSYSHTLFAVRAEKMNQVDLMQAVIVAINTFDYYRAAIHDLDLMPKIYINAQFEAVDTLAKEVLFPAFSEILFDRKVTTDLKLEFANEVLGSELNVGARMFVSHSGPTFPAQKPTDSAVVHLFLAEAAARRPIDSSIFKQADYTAKARRVNCEENHPCGNGGVQ